MRDIKFRAWDKVAKRMSIPFVLFGEFTLVGAIHSWQRESGIEGDSLGRLNDLEVMQFTGLKDKNGKDIYEGDIVKWDDGSNGKYWRVAEVFYDNDDAMFSFRIIDCINCKIEKGYVFNGNFGLRGTNPSNGLIIIGNVYENIGSFPVLPIRSKDK